MSPMSCATPLMSISGYAQGIEQGVLRQERPYHPEESVRLTELVNSLLTLSRMESDKLPGADFGIFERCDWRLFRPLSWAGSAKGRCSRCLVVDETLAVLGDEELLGKVPDNLVSNAVRYAKTSVAVVVTEENRHIQILRSGRRGGIGESDLPHLFERCYKGPEVTFGLGLSIAQTAAKTMGGTLAAANRPEGGAAFVLTLPRPDTHKAEET